MKGKKSFLFGGIICVILVLGSVFMIRENDKEREEKILRAIGDLPEDMVAQAAE